MIECNEGQSPLPPGLKSRGSEKKSEIRTNKLMKTGILLHDQMLGHSGEREC